MAWIESHTVLSRHRKVVELSETLGIKPVYAMAHLHALWHSALEQQEDGNLAKWTPQFIAQSAQYDGDPDAFVAALRDHNWLDGTLLHDWIDYAGMFLTRKYASSKIDLLRKIWRLHYRRYGVVNGKKTVSERKVSLPNLPNLPNLTIPNKTNKDIAPASKFVKPTAPEVTAYAKSIGFVLDGQHFVDYYESNGWRVGRNPMKDWKATVRTWNKNGFSKSNTVSHPLLPYKEVLPDESELPTAEEIREMIEKSKLKDGNLVLNNGLNNERHD